ncbi:MAG TPA: hypothetical protein PJ994_08360 [Tepidiformaceae bacterium]|nr:hypothetical protein [Tepidiformaceae bacterium]HMO96850.1 hypothetical protein [Tepidiformaceae bacterium]
MTTAERTAEVYYQGPGLATETWGFTQANFFVALRGRAGKESAILLNDPAARQLASELEIEDTPENRERLARAVGEAWLPRAAAGGSVESLVTVSVAFLNRNPELVAAVKRALA